MLFLFFVQVLLPVETTSVSVNVTAHEVGQVTAHLLSNNTDFNRYNRCRYSSSSMHAIRS